ncbi:AarF/ABC1/UbiB kinase family protein [Bifidobacterium breve]|uniref:ABC1 kinase family protein n=1 Tax=Bifidobacterium breve TaxID=1685 RepID=UPI0006CB52F2|nr:AarF/UbiB family protein [Bifidobacterium breve]ALE14044.1 Putative ubiquinone biosynthesis protein AarF [Bifidobacterium breve]AQM42353.1 ABC transporter [Bifidobacterium breve]MBK5036315.1 AarF/ABC1/UbiB kinase family protein [Bifidobacterium breve]MBK5054987.1 AarF/ABC1/UbiB kinase family protein [Bifidobacterium breve]OQM63583.1 ABC transporter [Bifidobacterium breve]
MTKPTRTTPESESTPLSSRVDPILTPAKAEREAAANRSADTSDTLKRTVDKATPSVSDETLALFGRRNDFATRYHLTRRGKIKRLGQITRIVEQFDVLHGLTPVKMRLMFEALGPTFVKVGQILSMRSEILPQSFCDELAKLRADADPMPYSTVLDVLATEYGRPADEVFAHIDPKPLGSASLAQVHRATLKTGEDVAIKVQRPGVRETMAQDVSIMRSIAKAATKVIRTSQIVDLKGVVEELWDTFESETDFLIEARNLAEFKRFSVRFKYMDCPTVYVELCTEHVVVMEYIDGISVSHPGQLIDAGYDLKEIGTKLVDNYATQILDDGFFHADPHPGNILIRGGQIVLIDLGMTGRLDQRTRTVLKEMIFAVAKQDSPALAEGLLRFAGTEADPEDYPALLADLDVIVKEFGTVDLAELDIAAFLTALTQMAGRHNIEVPSTVTTIGRALVTLEGLLDEFIPDVNMIEIISDHIATSKSLKNATKDEIKSLGVEGHQALHATLSTMTELKTVARMLTRGQLRVNMELVGSEEPFQLLSDMVNRLTMALIVVGLFVGSSIVYYAGMKPIIFGIPVIGFMGYVVAFALGVWIVIDIYLKGRKTKKR